MELQKKNPPFGGFEGVPITEMRRIFISPGPIYEPGEMEYRRTGLGPGDVCRRIPTRRHCH